MAGALILGRYRPISQAGAGGFATVQVAWDTRIQRRVAIKCIRLNARNAEVVEGRDSFSMYDQAQVPGLEEARTAAMLQDPNIVGIYDFALQDGMAYLIMEYVEGVTLSRLLDEHADAVDLDVISAVFEGVSHALEVAHGNRVLHLDIKPDNVMINRQGQVKVTDFGLSTLAGSTGFSQASGGSIGYMPPEQMNRQPLDERCDEWALASIVYEMVSGKNPFAADTVAQARRAIANAELVLPSLCRPELDEGVDDVIFFALDPDREERYGSVREFADELRPFLGSAERGKRKLSRIVGHAVGDADAHDDVQPTAVLAGVTDRLDRMAGFADEDCDQDGGGRLSRNLLLRIWSLVNCAILSLAACGGMNMPAGIPDALSWLAAAVVWAAALFVPHLGALAALVFLGAAFCSHGATVCGGALIVAGAVWWLAAGRRSAMAPLAVLSASTFGCFGFAATGALLGGIGLRMRKGAVNAAASACLATVLASMGSLAIDGWQGLKVLPALLSPGTSTVYMTAACDRQLLSLVSDPSYWVGVVAWIAAGMVCALVAGRGGIVRRLAGVAVAACVLLACLVGGSLAESAGAAVSLAASEAAAPAGSCVIALVLAAVTARSETEGEDRR